MYSIAAERSLWKIILLLYYTFILLFLFPTVTACYFSKLEEGKLDEASDNNCNFGFPLK